MGEWRDRARIARAGRTQTKTGRVLAGVARAGTKTWPGGAGAAMAPAAEGADELQVPAAPAAALGRPLSLPGSAWRGRWAEGAAGGAGGRWGFLRAWGGETPSGQRWCSWAGQGRGASGE